MLLHRGDPRSFDREIYARLTRPERWAATRRFIIRIGPGYRNHRNYPDDETPASVARHSVLWGEFLLGYAVAGFWAVCAPALVIPFDWAGLDWARSVDTMSVLIVCWIAAIAGAALIWLRGRQINRWFVERYPELDGRPFWRPLSAAQAE